ncbi:hypothetical protein MUG78_17795 [Gordonia alkaliphila]|uniref:hypothetical protein n=1 Tax=Gordonia alkaliphila TaxID=1053547 RepID=UPI001FF5AAA5|nr:hypothetical protein [Gordonia alkaliphila]MCK0441255.1 hypothetical protein [Gordonia alkaliphila]
MATMFEVWGFGNVVAAGPEDDYLARMQTGLAAGAADRGIDATEPSDALDMARDIILTDWIGADDWKIVDGTLYVTYGGIGISLDALIAEHADPFLGGQ